MVTDPKKNCLIRDSPDESRTDVKVRDFSGLRASTELKVLPAPDTPGRPTGVEGLIWPFSLAFGRTPSVCCC